MSAGSAGALGTPTRFFRYMSKYTVCAPAFRSCGGKMRFEAAAITPGFANRRQNGTDPSAKSTQSGSEPRRLHGPGAAGGVVGAAGRTHDGGGNETAAQG